MDSTELTVRLATPGDAAEVISLAALMYEAMGVDASDDRWRQAGSEALTHRLGLDAAVFVVDDPTGGGRLVASGAGTIARRLPGPGNPDAGVGYIQWVSTDPGWRRHGLARRITVSLLHWYEERGVPSIELHATRDGEKLYRSLGFEEGPNPALRLRRKLP
ncbi:MAG: GNAT family N-acetyltransferase [Actinomycetes bacterium]